MFKIVAISHRPWIIKLLPSSGWRKEERCSRSDLGTKVERPGDTAALKTVCLYVPTLTQFLAPLRKPHILLTTGPEPSSILRLCIEQTVWLASNRGIWWGPQTS